MKTIWQGWSGRRGPLLGNRAFVRLWAGQTISEFGSWLGALSLLAILTLDASPAQMGLLETMRSLPALLLGLLAGVWIDRLRRRPILIAADLGRAGLLVLVVVAALSGTLRIGHLYPIFFLIGGLTMLFNLAYHAYVPAVVKRERLVEANSKLGMTSSLAEIASPGLGGLLVQLLSAPFTLLLDGLSYIASAIFIGVIDRPEADPATGREEGQTVWRELKTGLRLAVGHRLLRPLILASATRSFFGGFFAALYGLYVLREIGLSPAVLGLLIGAGGIGALVGAAAVGRFNKRLGMGKALIVSLAISGWLTILIPLASGPAVWAVILLLIGQIVGDLFLTMFFIGSLSLRQAVTPDHLLGRIGASFEFLVGGLGTAGILCGGLIGEGLGLRPAVAVAAAGSVLAVVWLIFSPVRNLWSLREWQIEWESALGNGRPDD